MHLFSPQPPLPFHILPTCVLALAFGMMWGSPTAHAMLVSENGPSRANRPHTSQAGPSLAADLAQYRAYFDAQHNVDTTTLTRPQFVRLSTPTRAYKNQTEADLMAQGHVPTDDAIITTALKSAIEQLIEFIQEGDDLLQCRIFALIEQHLLRPHHPHTMPASAYELSKFFAHPHLSDADKEARLGCLSTIQCTPEALHSKLKHRLYMPIKTPAATDRWRSTHSDTY